MGGRMVTLVKAVISILLVLITAKSYSQETISFGLYQDARLALFGDNKSYNPFTLDMLLRVELQGKDNPNGYFVVAPSLEYARLKNGDELDHYRRWSADIGYTFNSFIDLPMEANVSFSPGLISRWGNKSFFSLGVNFELTYRLIKNVKLCLLWQIVQRTDLKWAYGTTGGKHSGFIGLKYSLL